MITSLRITILFLLALCSSAAWSQSVYNIVDYGAVPDTTQLSTKAIQKAVDDCAAHGGGIVLVPPGNYLSGTIQLKSFVNLHLEAGATLYASRRSEDFSNFTREIGAADNAEAEMLVGAVNAQDISITGQGTLHCQAERVGYRREPKTEVTDSITAREIVNAGLYGVDYQSKFKKVPPCPGAINFTGCTNIRIRDIQVVESSFWSVHLQWCNRVSVDGIYIISDPHNGVNADGLDIDGCSNVTVSNCRIDTGDDALCLKTTRQNGKTQPCQYITISNCILTSSSAALKIGTESHSDFEYITVSNCVINRANRGLNIIVRDGGTVRNVIFSNMTINTVRKETFWWGNGDPVWFTIQKRGNIPSAGNIENITLSNIIAYGQSGIRMEGFSNRMKNIRLRDIQLFMEPEDAIDKRSRNGFLFHGVDELSLVDCLVRWNKDKPEKLWESAYLFREINDLTLIRVKGEKAPDSQYEAFRYEGCEKLTINK